MALDTRERILTAAQEEFLERGLRAARIAAICRKADVANGTFYLHFRTKEELLEELLARVASELGRRLVATHATPGLDARARDRLETEEIVRFAEERSALFRFLMAERNAEAQAHRVFNDRLIAQRCAVIGEGIAQGEFRAELDPMITALADIGVTSEVVQWWLRNPGAMSRDALVEALVDLRARMYFPDA